MAVTWVVNPFTGALDAVGFPGAAPFVTSVAGGVGITNSPEPIVGAGTVNLDIDSLTTLVGSVAAGDLFPLVDIDAGGTAINNQRKVTFTNLVTAINPLLDHGTLLGLADDDHTQYLLLAGRAGGQVGIGGTGSGDDLTLRSTSHSTKGDLIWDDAQQWWPSIPDPTSNFSVARFDATLTDNSPARTSRLLLFDPAITAAPLINTGGTWALIDLAGTWSGHAAGHDDLFYALRFRSAWNGTLDPFPGPTIRRLFADESVTYTTGGSVFNSLPLTHHSGLYCVPSFTADGATAWLGIGTRVLGSFWQPSISALNGATVTGRDGVSANLFAHFVENPIVITSGGGTVDIGQVVALQVQDLTAGATNISMRSVGASVHMRHVGPVVIGANAAPTNSSIALEVQGTTRAIRTSVLTTAQKTALTALNGMWTYDDDLDRMSFYENGAWVGYVNGSGAANRVAFWTDASTIDDDADFLWNSGTNCLTVGADASTTSGFLVLGSAVGMDIDIARAVAVSDANGIHNYVARQHQVAGVQANISLQMKRSRGDEGTPTIVVDGDTLGLLEAQGFDGTSAYPPAAQLHFLAGVGSQSATSMPGAITLSTAPDGAIVPVERWRWLATGETNVCVTAPTVAATYNTLNVLPNGATITASLSPAIRALLFNGTLTFAAAATTIGQLFQSAPTITTSGASRVLGPLIGLGVNAVFTPASTHTITGTASRAVNHAPTFTDNGTAGSTASDVYGLRQAGNLNTNWTVTDWAAVKMLDPGGSGGALTRLGAVEVDALTRGTSNYSLWSKGSDVIVSHAGGAAFATGTATFTALTNASVGLEVQGTTKAFRYSQLTDAQRTTLTGVAVNDGMALYDTTRNTVSMRMHSNWLDVPGWYHIIVKSADQTVTNTTTLTDDTELQFSVGADEVWHVELRLGMSGNNAASDAKWGFTAAAASFVVAQSNWNAVHYTAAAALTQVNATAFASTTEAVTGGTAAVDAGTSTTIWPVFAVYRFRTSAATTIKVQFALLAGAAVGRNAVMEAGSTLFARRIS